MKLSEIISVIENFAPPSLQESYDNAGLLVGTPDMEVTGAILCLDSTEAVLDEALKKGANLIIAHHPILFSGLKRLNGKNYVERVIIKAVQNNLAIYAAHTNLDHVRQGVNGLIGERLGIADYQVLNPLKNRLRKLVVFCPQSHTEKVREALFSAGAGTIGKYDMCSFNIEGKGTFRGNDDTNPFVGQPGKLHTEEEVRIETIFPEYFEGRIISAMKAVHPYEEVAYDVYPLSNSNFSVGSGMVGELQQEMAETEFFDFVKEKMCVPVIRHTPFRGKKIKRVAWCGGAGFFLLPNAIAAGADAFITGDVKYHQFFDAENKIVMMDIGHYESEQFTPEIFYRIIREKFPTFALHLSNINTNPVTYY